MKKRLIKKKAKIFLSGKVSYPVCYDYRIYSSDGDYETLLFYDVPAPILAKAHEIAYSVGWNGVWYSAPEMIATLGYKSQTWDANPFWGFSDEYIQKMSLEAHRCYAGVPKYF